jgi:hypothetical protein
MRDPVISLFHHANGTRVAIVQEESSADFWEKHDNHDRNNTDEYIEDVPLPPLFAAATDLLAALKGMVAMVEAEYGGFDAVPEWQVATEAINKAERKERNP